MMPPEDFEALARVCPETVTLELISGKLEVKPVADGDHDEIIMWVAMQCVQQRPELRLYRGRGLRIGGDHNDRARPDGTLARAGRFAGDGAWSSPDRRADTRRRASRCASSSTAGPALSPSVANPTRLATGISACTTSAKPPPSPHPASITLDTEELKNYTG